MTATVEPTMRDKVYFASIAAAREIVYGTIACALIDFNFYHDEHSEKVEKIAASLRHHFVFAHICSAEHDWFAVLQKAATDTGAIKRLSCHDLRWMAVVIKATLSGKPTFTLGRVAKLTLKEPM